MGLIQPLQFGSSEADWDSWMSTLVAWSSNLDNVTNGLPVTAQGVQNVIYNVPNTAGVSLLQIVPTLPATGEFDGQLVYQQSNENLYTWSASTSAWRHVSVVFKGVWSATEQYFVGDEVIASDSNLYVAIADNIGQDPIVSPGSWVAIFSTVTSLASTVHLVSGDDLTVLTGTFNTTTISMLFVNSQITGPVASGPVTIDVEIDTVTSISNTLQFPFTAAPCFMLSVVTAPGTHNFVVRVNNQDANSIVVVTNLTILSLNR